MSHGSHSHGGMNEHSTMASHHSTAQMNHQASENSHGGHGQTVGHEMMFHLRSDLNLLFKSWDISSTKVLVGSCIAVLFVSILYEGLKIFRARLMDNRKRMGKQTEQTDCWINMCNAHHFSQTVLHIVQVVLGYLLMLVVMTFQVYLGIAVVIGAGLGYFFFAGWFSGTAPRAPLSSSNPTPENPAMILNLTNFKDLDEKQHHPEKLMFTNFAIANKGFNMENNDANK